MPKITPELKGTTATSVNRSGSTVAWTNPSLCLEFDSQSAYCSGGSGAKTQFLRVTGFTVNTNQLPSDSTISSILVRVYTSAIESSGVVSVWYDDSAQITVSGTPVGSNQASLANVSTTSTYREYLFTLSPGVVTAANALGGVVGFQVGYSVSTNVVAVPANWTVTIDDVGTRNYHLPFTGSGTISYGGGIESVPPSPTVDDLAGVVNGYSSDAFSGTATITATWTGGGTAPSYLDLYVTALVSGDTGGGSTNINGQINLGGSVSSTGASASVNIGKVIRIYPLGGTATKDIIYQIDVTRDWGPAEAGSLPHATALRSFSATVVQPSATRLSVDYIGLSYYYDSNTIPATPLPVGEDDSAYYEPPTTSAPTPLMDWIPRWMNPNYDETSTMRKLWYAGFPERIREMHDSIDDKFYPSFYGRTSQPRQVYVAKFTQSITLLPRVILVTDHPYASSGYVRISDTYENFLFDEIRPIAIRNNDFALHLRGLSQVYRTVVAASGILDLTAGLAADPPYADTVFVLVDAYNRKILIDSADSRYADSNINIGVSGTFKVYWQSQALHAKLMNGSAYILVDGREVPLTVSDIQNTWDEYALYVGRKRKYGETNVSVKRYCQQLSIPGTINNNIASNLGFGETTWWPSIASGTIDLTSLSATDLTVWDTPKKIFITENPAKDGLTYKLRYVPQGTVCVYIDGRHITPDHYQLSSNSLLPRGSIFVGVEPSQIVVKYQLDAYTTTKVGDSITTVQANTLGPKVPLILTSSKVKTLSVSKRVEDWRWNFFIPLLKGAAEFD